MFQRGFDAFQMDFTGAYREFFWGFCGLPREF